MSRPRPRTISPDEVRITREGTDAIFTYADSAMGSFNLGIGPQIINMSDEELLELHNEAAEAMLAHRDSYEHVAVEIPIGKPQIEWHDSCDQWSMTGDVLRCEVGHGHNPATGEPAPNIKIDNRELTWAEFGKMISSLEGWGIRLVVVPDDETHILPDIQVMDSREEKRGN